MFPHFMFILYVLSPRGINLNPLYRIWHTFLIATNQEIIFTKKKTKTNQTPPPLQDIKFPVSQFACEYLKKKTNIPKHCYNLSSPLCIPFIFYTSFASEENRQNHSCKCWHGLCKFSLVSFIWLYMFYVFITYSILFVCFFFSLFLSRLFLYFFISSVSRRTVYIVLYFFFFFFLPNSSAQRQILLFISCLLLLSFSHHHSLILSITRFAFSLFAGIILLSYTRRHMLLILLIENAADLILIRL